MKVLFRLTVLALATGLVGCQHAALSKPPASVDPVPPRVQGQSAPPASAASTQSQSQALSVITLHLAQEKAEASLMAVDVGKAKLYALPQPVITQSDIWRVSPVTMPDKRAFIMLEMNQQGIPKLHSATQQARGHYFLLSIQGQLVNVAQIAEPIADGRLLINMQSPEHAQAIIKMMQGG